MQAVIDDTNPIYVTDDSPNNEARYRVRFYLDPNSATISGGVVPIFFGFSGATVVVRLELYYSSGSYKIRARVLKDDSSWTYGSYVNISDASHYIELDWMAASSQGANDGYLTVWIDGGQVTSLSSADNDTHRIGSASLGVTGVLSAGTSGTLFFDAFESRRSTYIGQAGMRLHYMGKSMPKAGLMKLIAVQPNVAGRYAPLYEEIVIDAPTDYLFNGKHFDSYINLYWVESRWYDDQLGRFISPDPIIPETHNPLAYDRYQYVYSNPVRYTDSSGHCIDGITTVACVVIIGGVALKAIDYGWTAYDTYRSSNVLADPNASREDKLFAGLNVAMAIVFEAMEPDELLPVGLPLDDVTRKAVLAGAKEAYREGGEAALERFLRDQLGDHADDVLKRIGFNTSNFANPEMLLEHFNKHGAEFGYKTADEYLSGARALTSGGKGIETFTRANGDILFYKASTNEFVVLTRGGRIRTYFKPGKGMDYWRKMIRKR